MLEYCTKFSSKIIKFLTAIFVFIVDHVYWEYHNVKPGISDTLKCLTGKTAIVTGGNSGIGLMTTKLLASRGCKVIIACRRDAVKEKDEVIKETNNPNIRVKRLDLSHMESVRRFAEDIKKEEKKIDILINNAGIGYSDNTISQDGLDLVMQANYLGHFLLTHLIIDLLKASDDARIVFLTSGLSLASKIRVKDLYPTIPTTVKSRLASYANSKLLNILVAQEMAKKVEKFGIKVNSADPGVVYTPIFETLEGEGEGKFFFRWLFGFLVILVGGSMKKAANTSFHLAASEDIGTGLNYFRCTSIWKPRILKNEDLCAAIWTETEKIVKLLPEEKL